MNKHLLPIVLVIVSIAAVPVSAESGSRSGYGHSRGGPHGGRSDLFTQTSIEKGWQAATDQQKPMLVMFTTDGCHYCRKMLAETYSNPAVRQMLAGNAETVLAHAEDYRELVKKLGIRGYPSSMLISPKGDVLEFITGYVDAKTFTKRVGPLLTDRTARVGQASADSSNTAER